MIREGTGVINNNQRFASTGPIRIHHENPNPNAKLMREASVHV